MKHQMKSFALLILYIVCCQSIGFSQQRIESLKSNLLISRSSADSIETLKAITGIYCSDNIDSCFWYGNKALAIALSLNDSLSVATVYNCFGNACFYAALYEKALEYYQISKDIFQKINNEVGLAKAYNNMGIIYEISDKNEIALENYNKSLELWQKINNFSSGEAETMKIIASIYNNMGIVYKNIGSLDKALEYYNESLEISSKIKDEVGLISNTLCNIGLIHYEKKNYNEALNYLNQSLELDRKLNNKHGMAISLNNLGNILFNIGKFNQSYAHQREALNIASEIAATELIKNACFGLYQYYDRLKISDSALKYQGLFYNLKDSIYSNESKSRIAALENKFAFEKKDNEIKLLKAEQELKEMRLRAWKKWLYVSLCGIFLSFIFIVLILFQKQRKDRANKELVRKNLEILQSEENLRSRLEQVRTETVTPPEQNPVPRYAASALTEVQKEEIKRMIAEVLEAEKFFLKSNFTIDELSDHLNISRTYISQVINEKFNLNFNAFINEYRVKEVIRMFTNAENNNLTIEAIAQSVGFGSKSSFNSAFKKYTGTTPSVFLKFTK
jgi:AraC-like DNA-binding protein/Tfp pilus assembly protein PilF